MSVLVPPAIRDKDHPAEIPCCYGSAIAEHMCTCWRPVYDLEQAPLEAVPENHPPATRAKCCHDCAYRNGSPERSEDYEEEWLLGLAGDERQEFWCHQGVRRVVAFKHPDGRELPAGDGDYRPPIGPAERPIVWKADGTPGERCAGWAAHGGRNRAGSALTPLEDENGPAALERPGPDTEGVTPVHDQPTSGERTNTQRARRAEKAAIAYDGREDQWSPEDQDQAHQVVKDLLGDIRHLCDRVGVDFDAADRAAYNVYAAEKGEDAEGEWRVWSEAFR